MKEYEPQKISKIAQDYWQKNQSFVAKVDKTKEKFYCLSMFPYPSGKLHMGHLRNYTLSDIIARFKRMCGKNVLHPIGWDSFGLPAENAAKEHGVSASSWTDKNIIAMKNQLKSLGLSFDWSKEIKTSDPGFYKFEQEFFLKLVEKRIAYKKLAEVNWDPVDKTVLANEQVINGRGWRSGALVEKKKIKQWFLKITDYAEELEQGLENLPNWPDNVKNLQKNWIGKSKGHLVKFKVLDINDFDLTVYTTRLDTLFGVRYLALALDHPLVQKAKQTKDLLDFINKEKLGNTKEEDFSKIKKEGFKISLKAINPINNEQIDIYIANFVLMNYATGAVMATPAHDKRDFEFAKKYNISITPVIYQKQNDELPFLGYGKLKNSQEFNELSSKKAKQEIYKKLLEKNACQEKINYRLHDWGISRQRYWGAPIPMLIDKNAQDIALKKEDLPLICPDDSNIKTDENPLNNKAWQEQFFNKYNAKIDGQTFDTFVESSWYYARFCSSDSKEMLDQEKTDYWLSVDQYIGGIEHACMHLLYFRFFHKLLKKEGLVKDDEPVKNLLCQGMVLAKTFYKIQNGKKIWLNQKDVTAKNDSYFYKTTDQKVHYIGMQKMSKSKNNGIDPNELLEKYGADTLRLFILFAAPPKVALEWQENSLEGSHRFLKRIWQKYIVLKNNYLISEKNEFLTLDSSLKYSLEQQEVLMKLQKTIEKVTDDIDRRQSFNTAIAAIMELFNVFAALEINSKNSTVILHVFFQIILMLNPICSHLCFYIWHEVFSEDITFKPWPKLNKSFIKEESITLIIQVNSKIRAKISLKKDQEKNLAIKEAQKDPKVIKYLTNKTIKKTIYVANKIINFIAV